MQTVEISVRQLVEFILRSGDIDTRYHGRSGYAMLEGAKIHRMIQGSQGSDYTSEVPLELEIPGEEYSIRLSGRADGIITKGDDVTIDEIKGMYADVEKLAEPAEVHLAQAKCYALIYARQEGLQRISVRMTYCNIETKNIRYFESGYTIEELSEWFDGLIAKYRPWAEFRIRWGNKRNASIRGVEFPYAYRPGQRELAADVYRTIYHKKRLFLEAPTGVGKTLAVLFPAIKAVGEGIGGTIFYLTAKNVAAAVALDTFRLLKSRGLVFRTVHLIAKEKLCPMEKPLCDPESCPCAKGHFDRINDALFEFLQTEDAYEKENIRHHAAKHRVCPFEMALDLSLFCDGIVCDYNYVFDPRASLKRFFGDGRKGEHLFLIDEAHNLVERAREMYSAQLIREEVLDVRKRLKGTDRQLTGYLTSLNRELAELDSGEEEKYRLHTFISDVILAAQRLAGRFEEVLKEKPIEDEEVLQFYFGVREFLDISERLNEKYRIYSEYTEDGRFRLKLFNVDPSDNLRACLDQGRSSIFFSATILPVTYYMDLLTGSREDYAVYARSSFDPEHLGVFLADDVSSRYSRRSPEEFERIAKRLHGIIQARRGNYLVFFPSYRFLEEVYGCFSSLKGGEVECVVQDKTMTEEEKEEFLSRFRYTGTGEGELRELIRAEIEVVGDRSLAGFCVLGGLFSEGIDLTEESLIGAVIVGTGLPMVCTEREILRDYFDETGRDGFDYAFRVPGMNKVLQAAGRVIRTERDTGIVALLDERFKYGEYTRMFPAEWKNIKLLKPGDAEPVRRFWSDQQSGQAAARQE